jgi:hypothetical protein
MFACRLRHLALTTNSPHLLTSIASARRSELHFATVAAAFDKNMLKVVETLETIEKMLAEASKTFGDAAKTVAETPGDLLLDLCE